MQGQISFLLGLQQAFPLGSVWVSDPCRGMSRRGMSRSSLCCICSL